MVDLGSQYYRYGYRRVAMLRAQGLGVNHKRAERLARLLVE